MCKLHSSPPKIACPQEISYLDASKSSYSQVASSFGTPSLAPSALLCFYSLIFFRCNLSSGTHVLQFCVPKCKETWIMHIDISYNITTNTKRINQIKKIQICANNIYLLILETFINFHPFLLLYNFLKLVLRYQNLSFLIFQENFRKESPCLLLQYSYYSHLLKC